MRKLWFDLRRSLQQAEETTTVDHAVRTSEPPEPWLVLDVNTGRLWFTPVNAPRPRSLAIAATHIDGPPPADEPWPLYRQPLTEPDPNHDSVLNRLRAAAQQGHRWLVADVSTPPRLHTTSAYDTDTVPDTAVWSPAWLTAGDLGPYPGQIAHGYQHNGSVIARFTKATVQRIAADADARAAHTPGRDADLLALRDYGSGMEVLMVRAPATPAGPVPGDESSAVGMRHVTADPDGWYRLTDDRWPWRHATPPTQPPNRTRGAHEHDPDVFEPNGHDGSRCTVCGATGYDITYEELPSMAGYGTDTTMSCRICHSSESYAEEIGWSRRRAPWPPTL
ncbi:hypothetical protein [Micromonospora inyonensis]|uniref:Uncharacterized protein n=1 Tax=Micromonospora inyonensis TaxID=47866 RepID=A0A1C6RKQ2_9ACTN|nr:hypothetical protein [Micromonospora inyonensis]SCL17745.1 hypothetical protein GA0074694_2115 [Micromonospora inyonensis]